MVKNRHCFTKLRVEVSLIRKIEQIYLDKSLERELLVRNKELRNFIEEFYMI